MDERMKKPQVALAAGLLAVVSLILMSAPALAAFNHSTVETTFSAGSNCSVQDIAVDEARGIVYVVCDLPRTNVSRPNQVIRKFDLDGTPVNFSAKAPYIGGNEITESPTNPEGILGEPRIAVDNSVANNGYLYVAPGRDGSDSIDVFKPSGEWADAVISGGALNAPRFSDVDVGPDGSIYAIQGGAVGFVPHVTKFDSSLQEKLRLYTLELGSFVRVDSTGAVWTRFGEFPPRVSRYEQDQFTTNLGVGFGSPPALIDSVAATTSPFVSNPLLEAAGLGNFDVDLSDNDLYVDRGTRIDTYSAGTADELAHPNAPSFGIGTLSGSQAIAVTADHHVYASKAEGTVVRFGPGDIVPDIKTPQPAVDDVGHSSAIVGSRIELAGGTDISSCLVQYGKDTTYSGPGSGVAPCSPDPAENPPGSNFGEDENVSATLSGLATGTAYHYRFKAGNAKGENAGIDRVVVPAYVLKVKTFPATEIDDRSAKLHGAFDPDGLDTAYHFEYGVDTGYGLSTAEVDQGDEAGEVTVDGALDELPAGKTFHYRIAASNQNGTTYGPDQTFRVASTPDLSGVRASDLTATSAILRARVDPTGYSTKYHFDYGTTPEYGHSVPLEEEGIGSGPASVDVSQPIEGLQAGVTYHFRIVATNKWGSSSSSDTTFDFAPPSCPNDHIRQQTGSSYLPDCRAYELVSPGVAGSVRLFPSQAAWDGSHAQDPYGAGDSWALNTGLASSPSRFAFFGGVGAVTGLDPPNSELDMYMATRTIAGWVTTLPGVTGSQTEHGGRHECSEAMDMCIDHDEGRSGIAPPQSAPYLFSASGEPLGRLPTNLQAIPGGQDFTGAQRMSGDFSQFVFSSTDVVFAPGGIGGGLGSAYDNDLADRTVEILSKLPGGGDIPQDGTSTHAIEFPGLSPDGSHVLMQTPASNGPSHLYMRVNQSVTYDVSQGAGVTFVGMTRDGSKVFFIAGQRLTEDDTDSSADLYMWSEGGGVPQLTRISKGNGRGDSDACTPSWTDGCGVAPLSTERGHPDQLQSVPGLDDLIAEGNGDVYFYSPELLDGSRPAIEDQRNLYLYRNGAVHLVVTLDHGTEIDRMQISSNGSHAAMVTASRLTSYDNQGFKQMYTYDAGTGSIRCASCNPSGLPPNSDVEASQGGPFMSDDGRAFFATKDSLVPRDADGEVIDVYEYVDGRPQLISSGIGSRDFTGGGAIIGLGSTPEFTGLEGVSANGTDVYFSTFDTLVTQDQNGPYVKFYDARTGGGFASDTALAPCVAADECHGLDSSTPSPPVIGTGANLGAGGNAQTSAKPSKPRHRKRGKAKRRHARKHTGHRHG